MALPHLIANARLTQADVPDIDVRTLDSDSWENLDEEGRHWRQLWEFALTFDGWRYFGGDENVIPRLGAFSKSIEEAFHRTGTLPTIDLALLRACLFYEQRLYCKHSMEGPGPEAKSYLQALLDAIKASIL